MAGSKVHSNGNLRRPWHLWAVGFFFVGLSAAGIYDQIMLLLQDTAYVERQGFDEVQRAYFSDYPPSMAVLWACALWSLLIAAILLIGRSRWVQPAALIAVISQMVLNLVTFGFMDRWVMFGPALSIFDIAILVLTIGFFVYVRAMAARGLWR